MSDTDKQIRQLRTHFQQIVNSNPPVGKLGKASGEIFDREHPGSAFARQYAGNGQFNLPASYPYLLPDGSKIFAGMAIELGWKNGVQSITSKDRIGIITGGDNPVSDATSQYTSLQSVTALLVQPTNPVSMYVQVLGDTVIVNDVTYTAPTASVNLTSIEAGLAAGEHCYAVIYLLATYAGYEAKASTGKSALLSLDDTDINECHALKTAGSVALWAIEVEEGQTPFDNNDIYVLPSKDLRPFFTPGASSASLATANATAAIIASIPIAEGEAATIILDFAGAKSDYSAACGTTISGTVRRAVGGSVTIVGSPTVTTWEDSAGSPAGSIVATTSTLDAKVTGVAAETWNWRVTWRITRR